MNVAEFHQNIEQVWQKIEETLENQVMWIAKRKGRYLQSHLMIAHKSSLISKNRFLSFGLRVAWVDFILPIKTMIGWQMMVNAFGIL